MYETRHALHRFNRHLHRMLEPVSRAHRAVVTALGWPLLLCLVVLAAYTVIAGLWREPTNYDSLTYHLARTTYWIQHRSIEPYVTTIDRQLYQPPLAEYGLMLIRLLAGTDRLTFLIQWLAYLGCLLLVYRISRKLGASGRFAVVYAATVPMAILQASTPQNDMVAAFWCCAVAYFILSDEPLYTGAAAGLALLTKGTAYIYLAPLLLWFAWRMARKRRFTTLITAGLIALALNAPFYLRNLTTVGAPLYSGSDSYFNHEKSPRVLLSSLVRNAALNLPVPDDGLTLTRALGLNPADRGLSFGAYLTGYGITYLSEDSAAAPLHVLVLLLALPLAMVNRQTRALAGCLLAAVLLFCGLLLWQPWHTRLQMPLLMLWAAPLSAAIPRVLRRWFAVPMLAYALIVVPFANDNRSIPDWFAPLEYRDYDAAYFDFAAEMRASGCRLIRFDVASDEPEYILHALLPDATFTHDPAVPVCGVFRR